MNDDFDKAIAAWNPFYTTIATAAVTLIGLLFVAISINLRTILGKEHRHLRVLAVDAFVDFLLLLLFALYFLIPAQPSYFLSSLLLVTAASGLVHIIQQAISALRKSNGGARRLAFSHAAERIVMPAISFATIIGVAITLWDNNTSWLVALLFAFVALIISTTSIAWDLLLEVSEESSQPTSGGYSAPPSNIERERAVTQTSVGVGRRSSTTFEASGQSLGNDTSRDEKQSGTDRYFALLLVAVFAVIYRLMRRVMPDLRKG